MFNNKLKKESIERLNGLQNKYKTTADNAQKKAVELYEDRKKSISIIDKIELYINNLANTPKEFKKDMEEVKVNKSEFSQAVELEKDSEKFAKIAGGSAVGGAAVGAGVAAFGPTAAMAIATTFGTASTGTAISALSGAAATNAALAWLGGGALAAGGGGMAAGNAFLALAGPIGWGIGAAGMGIGAITMINKNKKIAEKANKESEKVQEAMLKMRKAQTNISKIKKVTNDMNNGIYMSFENLSKNKLNDYTKFSKEEKIELGSLVNNLKSLSKLINKRLDGESMEEIEYIKHNNKSHSNSTI